MTHQHKTLEDTIYFWFGANDTSGSGNDGASAAADVRLAGATAGAAPVLSPTPTLLSHANFPAGCYEVAVAATAANGFAATNTYAVFCTLLVDSQNPTGFVGSFTLDPIIANMKELNDGAQSAADLQDFADAGYDPATNKVQGVVLTDTTTSNTDMRGTDSAALASVLGALTDAAATGDPTTADTIMQYIKQLINILIGTDGIATFPAEAAPANNVSLAEVIRAIHDDTKSLNDDTISEITGASDVPTTPTLKQAAMLTYMRERNNTQTTSAERRIFNDAGTEVLDATMSDDGTTFSQGKLGDA